MAHEDCSVDRRIFFFECLPTQGCKDLCALVTSATVRVVCEIALLPLDFPFLQCVGIAEDVAFGVKEL